MQNGTKERKRTPERRESVRYVRCVRKRKRIIYLYKLKYPNARNGLCKKLTLSVKARVLKKDASPEGSNASGFRRLRPDVRPPDLGVFFNPLDPPLKSKYNCAKKKKSQREVRRFCKKEERINLSKPLQN